MELQEFLTRFSNGDMDVIQQPLCGLCYNIERQCGFESRELFESTFKSWKKGTDCPSYPGPEPYFRQYLYRDNQLKLRKDLARHALNKLFFKKSIFEKMLELLRIK